MIADRLRAAILQAAISGKLTDQRPEDGTATELLEQIKAKRAALVKAKKLKKQKPLPPITDEDQPFPIPSNWVWARFGEAARYAQRGKSPTYADVSPYLAVSQKCVRWTGFDPALARPYASEAFAALPQDRILSAGDILWNSTGTGTVGRSTVLPESGDFGKMAADSHVTVIRTFPEVLPRFIDTFISSPHIQQNMDDLTSGTTKQQELNLGTILELPLPIPPLAEQERIVAKLDEVLPLIDQLAELESDREYLDRKVAKAIERAILQAAISGKLTKQLPEDGTAAELLETIKTERHQLEKEGKIKKQKPLSPVYKADEPFELPGTWAYPALGEIVTLIRGITFPASAKHKESFTGAVRCLTTGSVQSRYSDSADVFVDASFVKRSDQYLSRGDAILSTANSTALVGKSIYWDEAHERTFGGFLTVARAMDSRPAATRYLHTVLRTLFLGGAFAEKSTQTTNIANLSNKILYGVRIPLPPAAEQERIVAKLDRVQPLVRSIEELVS